MTRDKSRKAAEAIEQLTLFPFTERQELAIKEANERRDAELNPIAIELGYDLADKAGYTINHLSAIVEQTIDAIMSEPSMRQYDRNSPEVDKIVRSALKGMPIEIFPEFAKNLNTLSVSQGKASQQLKGMEIVKDKLGRMFAFLPGSKIGTVKMNRIPPVVDNNKDPYNRFHPDLMMDQHLRRIVARDNLNINLPQRGLTAEEVSAVKSLDDSQSLDPLHADLDGLKNAGIRRPEVSIQKGMPVATDQQKKAIQLAMVFDAGTDRDQLNGIPLPQPSLIKLEDGSVVEVNHRRAGGHDKAFSVVQASPDLPNELVNEITDVRLESGPINFKHSPDDKARAKAMRIDPINTSARPTYKSEDALYEKMLNDLVTGTDDQGNRWISDAHPQIRDWFKTHVNEVFNYPIR